MPKPTTGRIEERPPEPDTEKMTTDTLMTSVFTALCLIAATAVLGTFGAAGLALGDMVSGKGSIGAAVGFAVGLALGMALIVLALRRYSQQIKGRSMNLYRGAWIGSIASLVIIVLMAYLPQIAIPQYCPPGDVCQNGQR
jgi:hypothetical protein